ncbi:MAG: glycosyltransferase family 2 protein, partial [Ignavibacteria bacterium]|nr:glycosyltransferase family 2 protein [Ignavibacteria bacterium]
MIPADTTTRLWPRDFAVLIPAYNAGNALAKQLPALTAAIPAASICVVDDGSNDTTAEICRVNGIHCLCHPINRGKGAALRTGFSFLLEHDFSWILTLDADGQHAVSDIPSLVAEARANPRAGIILGARTISLATMPPARIFSNSVTSA